MFENMVDPETKAELRREIHSFRATIAALEEAQELTGPAQMYAVQIAMAALEASPWMEARQRPTDAVKAP
jgi:inorganic triphosphatase YgiF